MPNHRCTFGLSLICATRHRLPAGAALAAAALGLCALPGCGPPPKPAEPDAVLLGDEPAAAGGVDEAAPPELKRAVAAIEKEAYAEALPLLDQVLKAEPDNAQAVYYRALALDMTGKREQAEQGYRRAIELDAGLVNARFNLAMLYLEDPPRPEPAIAVLEPAVRLDPKALDVREKLALAYQLAKQYDKAAAEYEAALGLSDVPRVHFNYADMLFEAGRREQAVPHMRQAFPAFQKDKENVVVLAQRFAQSHAYEDCVRAFGAAIALDAKNPGHYVYRGLCQHELKKEREAQQDFRAAAAADPSFQPAPYYLGRSLVASGQADEGARSLRRAVELGPGTPVGKKAAAELEEMKARGARR
ncbi:MAG: tetratricopeptide repeat protein [Deltaproteobacteria bacterium]|nr:tetratricopeptide repeat protein [Deltaproteobacteria bacterium]